MHLYKNNANVFAAVLTKSVLCKQLLPLITLQCEGLSIAYTPSCIKQQESKKFLKLWNKIDMNLSKHNPIKSHFLTPSNVAETSNFTRV